MKYPWRKSQTITAESYIRFKENPIEFARMILGIDLTALTPFAQRVYISGIDTIISGRGRSVIQGRGRNGISNQESDFLDALTLAATNRNRNQRPNQIIIDDPEVERAMPSWEQVRTMERLNIIGEHPFRILPPFPMSQENEDE